MRITALIITAVSGVLCIAAGAAFLAGTARRVAFEIPDGYVPDAQRGQYVFTAAGCGSCHRTTPDATTAESLPSFGGGEPIASPFGPIYASNISPDNESGIGYWDDVAFLNAVKRGVSPRGAHYYPAFPYARFARLATRDVLDIKAYLMTTPPVARRATKTDLPPPFNIRVGIGAWKLLNAPKALRADEAAPTDMFGRGRYLVEHAAHCQECHTPRTLTLGLNGAHAFEGAAGFDGAVAPPLTPQKLRDAGFEAFDQTMRFALTLDGTGSIEAKPMLDVVENISQLTDADRRAIYHYLSERDRTPHAPPP